MLEIGVCVGGFPAVKSGVKVELVIHPVLTSTGKPEMCYHMLKMREIQWPLGI